jgi:hypothetical protein
MTELRVSTSLATTHEAKNEFGGETHRETTDIYFLHIKSKFVYHIQLKHCYLRNFTQVPLTFTTFRRSITVYTKAHHWFVPQITYILSVPHHHTTD